MSFDSSVAEGAVSAALRLRGAENGPTPRAEGGLVSVYDDLCTAGEVTYEFVALVRRLARAVVRLRNFPPLDRHRYWTPEAIDDIVQDFFAACPINKRLSVLLAASPNEAAFVSGLETAIIRHVQSEFRKSPRGSVARTVRGVIDDEPRFEVRDDFVALPGWPPACQPAQCGEAVLHRAVERVEVVVPPWKANSAHRAPFADRPSIVRLVDTVLTIAGAPVAFNTVLDVVIGRCVIPELSREVPAGDYTLIDEPLAEPSEYASARAAEVWRQLTLQQRRALGALGGSIREAAPHIGVAKTRAGEVLAETRAALEGLLQDDPDAIDVARELLRLAADPDG